MNSFVFVLRIRAYRHPQYVQKEGVEKLVYVGSREIVWSADRVLSEESSVLTRGALQDVMQRMPSGIISFGFPTFGDGTKASESELLSEVVDCEDDDERTS